MPPATIAAAPSTTPGPEPLGRTEHERGERRRAQSVSVATSGETTETRPWK